MAAGAVARLGAASFRATFTAPSASTMPIRLTARDAAGATVTETVLSAYQASG